ncbi:MAG: hypothetical protein IBX57_00165 [Gammaproteobacteria bacterium]|nr:hypothetical protein [Gammaproteobacteria bacterium]
MAQIITDYDGLGYAGLADNLLYAQPHPNTLAFLQQQIEAPPANYTTVSNDFLSRARDLYERTSGSTAMRMAQAARRAFGSIWGSNDVRVLTDIGQFQWAKSHMRRWVMAEPTVREMYHNQQLEGYEGSYQDPFPQEASGEEFYDYRRVMDGVVVETDDGWYADTYYDELLEGDRELNHVEQVDILETWTNVVNLIRKGGDDPTSRWNASL